MATTTTAPTPRLQAGRAKRGHHPGLALAIIAGAQLMIVLDATIVNVALPHIQRALHFSAASLTWTLNAYTLTFGGLLLLGGRMGDILGRRRMFVVGVLLFALASLLGGFAMNQAWLLIFRALQGVGGAIASPTALALVTTNFEEGAERNKAFGVFAAVSGAGAAVGLVAGGMLTTWLNWRWVLFVNAPIAIVIALAAPLFIDESERYPGKFDMVGAITSTIGMTSLVYGFIHAAQHGWSDAVTIGAFIVAGALLAVFLMVERAHPQPIVPLHMFRDRNRAATYGIMLALAAALFSMFFFLTLFVQNPLLLGWSPLKAGFAFLPVSATIVVVAQIVSRLLLKVGPKPFTILGAICNAVGLFWLAQLGPHSTYVGGILGPIMVFATGMALLFVPLTIVAVSGVEAQESGAASALLNVMQQIGGSIGLAILTTVFATATTNEAKHLAGQAAAAHAKPTAQGLAQAQAHVFAHGVSTAFSFGVIFALIALALAVFALKASKEDLDVSAVPGMAA